MLFCLTFVYNVATCRFIYSLLCQNIRGVSQTRYDYCPGHPCSRKYQGIQGAGNCEIGPGRTLYAGNVCNVETGTFFLGLFC
ncbi:hypothetical protein FC546_24635 [Escherichia coli]|nr:hypothetical protein [Escherichia coli]